MPEPREYPVHVHTPPPVQECNTCFYEGQSLEEWPCRCSMSAAGINCWTPKEDANGPART